MKKRENSVKREWIYWLARSTVMEERGGQVSGAETLGLFTNALALHRCTKILEISLNILSHLQVCGGDNLSSHALA